MYFQTYEVLWEWKGLRNDDEKSPNIEGEGEDSGKIVGFEETFVHFTNFVSSDVILNQNRSNLNDLIVETSKLEAEQCSEFHF